MIRSVPLRRAVPLLLFGPVAAVLAGCADTTPPAAPPPVAGAPAVAAAPAGTSGATMLNDPSAPADTPLCGVAGREKMAIGDQLLPRHFADAGVCRTFACYDPATATYIGADGYRHVCR